MPLPETWDYQSPLLTPPDAEWWDEDDVPLEYAHPRHCPVCGALAHTNPAYCDEAYAPRRYGEDA